MKNDKYTAMQRHYVEKFVQPGAQEFLLGELTRLHAFIKDLHEKGQITDQEKAFALMEGIKQAEVDTVNKMEQLVSAYHEDLPITAHDVNRMLGWAFKWVNNQNTEMGRSKRK